MEYPHLIETTLSDYDERTYAIGIGQEDELTSEEKEVLAKSEAYVKAYNTKRDRKTLAKARKTFEQLRDIKGLPEKAIEILKYWTFREGDDEDEEE